MCEITSKFSNLLHDDFVYIYIYLSNINFERYSRVCNNLRQSCTYNIVHNNVRKGKEKDVDEELKRNI